MSRTTPPPASRPTLKLPAKAASTPETGDARPAARKPVRGGAKTAKPSLSQSLAQRTIRAAASTASPTAEARKDSEKPPFKREAARAPAHTVKPARPASTAAPRPALPQRTGERQAPEAPPKKVYPKRGIARSTGARALPPMRSDDARDTPRPEATRSSRPAPAPHTAHAETPVRRPANEPPRLSKRLSEMTQCSRREADEWIENGWVRVDGVVVTTLGTRAHPNARIEIQEEAGRHQTESVTIVLNKPADTASGAVDGDGESALQLIRPENRWAEDDTKSAFKATHLRGLQLAGKLDPEATGMLVFTQEGSVARRITGDETRLEKEYMVRVDGELSPEGLQLLNHGLSLDDVKLKRAQVSWQNEQQLRFVLHESRKRQIQRMCELVGLRVTAIKRIRIGSVSLGKLPAGQWRYLRENERF
jgi:23S rRNA pseudouridine2604 synthase